jgi:hypothetical protein
MLEYIKQQLAERYPTPTFAESNSEADTDELVVEYAHIFQELDDISVEGEDAHRSRALELDIPVEEDVELDTVELNLMDNRLMDVPMDVTAVTEHFNESMKTYDDFYQEACNMVQPFMREDEYHLHERRTAYAKKNYDEYHEQMVQEGMFGFDKFPITNSNVPTNIMRDFGPLTPSDESQRYMVKLPVEFEIDDNQNIMQSQLDALRVSKTANVFESFADVIREKLCQEFDCRIDDVWSMVTPKRVIVPTPKDNYEIIVEFECDGMDEPIYEGWSYARKPSVRNQDLQMYPHGKLNQMIENMITMNKRDYVKPVVHQETVTLSRWNNDSMYQESTEGRMIGPILAGTLGGGAVITLLGALIGGEIGATAGAYIGSTIGGIGSMWYINKKYDKMLSKGVLDEIEKVTKILCQTSDDVTIADLKKFHKAVRGLRNEMHSDINMLRDTNDGTILSPASKSKHINEHDIKVFEDLRDACDQVLYNVNDVNDTKNNEKYLKQLIKCMTAARDVVADVKPDNVNEGYMYQEAIDFGYPDETSEANKQNQPSDVPPAPDADPSAPTVNADPNATPDGGNADNMDQPPVDDPNATTPPDDNGEDNKLADTNDVSDQIADKIVNGDDSNQDTGVDANGDINLDDNSLETPDASATDTPEMDAGGFDNIDSSLDDLDNTTSSTNDAPMGDPANMDINSMSIDDIMAQAAEKLKSMPIDQVKQFLSDGTGGMDTTSSDLQQESFFLTKNNIRGEIDARLKKCLGDLNDNTKSLNEIIKAFKSSGKQLNKALTKAISWEERCKKSTMPNIMMKRRIFNDEELNHLNKLNSALVKLQTGLQPTASAEETNVVKGLIRAFTDEATIVGKFVSQ